MEKNRMSFAKDGYSTVKAKLIK